MKHDKNKIKYIHRCVHAIQVERVTQPLHSLLGEIPLLCEVKTLPLTCVVTIAHKLAAICRGYVLLHYIKDQSEFTIHISRPEMNSTCHKLFIHSECVMASKAKLQRYAVFNSQACNLHECIRTVHYLASLASPPLHVQPSGPPCRLASSSWPMAGTLHIWQDWLCREGLQRTPDKSLHPKKCTRASNRRSTRAEQRCEVHWLAHISSTYIATHTWAACPHTHCRIPHLLSYLS